MLIDINGPMFTDSAFLFVYMLMAVLFISGLIIFCIATVRVKVLPKWGAILLAMGCPFVYGGLMVPQILRALGAIISSVGLIWMGRALVQDKEN